MKHPYIETAELIEEILRLDAKLCAKSSYHGTLLGDTARKRLREEAKRERELARLEIGMAV